MKTPLLLVVLLIFFASCGNQQTQKTNTDQQSTSQSEIIEGKVFGSQISKEDIISANKLPSQMKKHETLTLKLEGKIDAVCQGSGCWLNMDIGNGETVHVTFKDEAFTLPKDIAGKNAVVEGFAITEIISVEMQKRMAEKEGKTQTEIEAISKSLIEYYFEAKGVTLLNDKGGVLNVE